MKKINRYALISMILAAVLALTAIAIAFLPKKYTSVDVTSDKLYEISDTTKRFVSKLDEDVTIYVLDSNMSDKKFEDYLAVYSELSDRITLEYVNTQNNEKVADMLAEYGFSSVYSPTPYSLLIVSEKRDQYVDYQNFFTYSNDTLGFDELSVSYYNYYYSYFASSTEYADYLESLVVDSEKKIHAESILNQMIEYVSVDVIPEAYFVTGHGEDSITEGNFAYLLYYYGYPFGVYDVTSGADVPSDASCIIINAPTEDYTAEECEKIQNYLKSGGNMLLMLSPENASMKNLMALSEYYGFSLIDGVVLEDNSAEEGEEVTVSNTVATMLNTDHDVFASVSMNSCALTKPSAIKIAENLRASQLVTPLVVTNDTAYIGDRENKGPFILGVAVEEETTSGNTRIVCFTGAESINAKEYSQDAMTLPVCALSWLAEGFVSEVEDIAPKLYQDKYLKVEQDKVIYLGAFFILVIPVALIGAGVAVSKNRKKR